MKRFLIAGFLTLSLALAGCDRLTRDRFDLLQVNTSNMTDVQKTLGDPTYRRDREWHYERASQHLNVLVEFDDQGQLTRKQWIDAVQGDWSDSKPNDSTGTRESIQVRTIK